VRLTLVEEEAAPSGAAALTLLKRGSTVSY
jgi:hypothetical protein